MNLFTSSISLASMLKSGNPWDRLMAPFSFAILVMTSKMVVPTSGSREVISNIELLRLFRYVSDKLQIVNDNRA